MSKFSRRQVLGGSSVLLVGAGIDGEAQAAPYERGTIHTDVCVVGAGFAGPSAAWRLKQAGVRVVLLEARNRVGGRSLTGPLEGGGWIDYGGQWVGPTQDAFYALIKEMGGETYPSPDYGASLERSIIDPQHFVRVEPDKDYPGKKILDAAFAKVDALADTIDPEKPWLAADAARLDATTFAEWLDRNIDNENARASVAGVVSSVACASPPEISILEMAYLVRACHGLDRLFSFKGGAQQDRVIYGTQPIAKAVAERLGFAVRLGQPVRRIKWDDEGAVVFTDEISVAARCVIVATPPGLAGAIEYDPSPPTDRVQVTQRWPQGLVIKVQMIYEEPYWRAEGLNGASLDYKAVVGETADSGVPEQYSKKGIMTGFVYSGQARQVVGLPPGERKTIVLRDMAERFGPKALETIEYHEMNWSTQQWTRACFTGFLTPGATTLFRSAVRDPIGPLYFAGTENSADWPSFIDGAIKSGERAAKAVKARL
ncbi:MAG: FAD-dependent oxidoreductase [Xanthobacteraceae bacterium]|jgi:monoamine oxidase